MIKLAISMAHADYAKRLDFLSKLYGTTESYGAIVSFNNALGFKPVSTYTSTPCGGYVINPTVPTPEDYDTPAVTLWDAMEFFDEENEVISIVMEDKNIKHPNSKYNYNTTDILFKFGNYVQKKFHGVNVSYAKMDDAYKQDVCNFVLSHFWKCLAYSKACDTMLSSHRKLTKVERRKILRVMSKIVDYTPDIYQEWCKTCYGYHPDCPIHIELIEAT